MSCTPSTLDIDKDIWREESYYIADEEQEFTWVPTVTSLTECGEVAFKLTMIDDSELDDDIFTSYDFSKPSKTLKVQSDDT